MPSRATVISVEATIARFSSRRLQRGLEAELEHLGSEADGE